MGPTLFLLINIVFFFFKVIDIAIRERTHIGKEEVHLSLIADDLFLFIEDPIDRTRKLLELINEFSKAQDTKLIHRNPLQTYSTTRKIRKRN